MSPAYPQEQLRGALAAESEAHRLLLAGRGDDAQPRLREAADLYRRSWEGAGGRSFGRLIGMLKAAILAGGGSDTASYVRDALGTSGDSPASWYALALAALVEGDDPLAATAAERMRLGSEAFARTADAIAALAERDGARYGQALGAIVADFEQREEHLTGVAIADTALVLERLAEGRGIAARPESPVLPPP